MTEPRVAIALLGPVRVDGLMAPFRRRAARELVAYLALHRAGARTAVWVDALWPTRSVSQATIHSTVSDARRALGRGADGTELLRRRESRLCLADCVVSDVECFARLASRPQLASWHAALSLIRGGLFDGLVLDDWAVFDGTRAHVESMVSATALKGAVHALREGCGAEAEWMIRQALRVSAYDERLYRALLRAADAQGNRAGLRSAMAELCVLARAPLSDDPSEQGGHRMTPVHPRTVALYRKLARGRFPATGGAFPRL